MNWVCWLTTSPDLHQPPISSCSSHSSILFGVRRCRLSFDFSDFPSCCDVGKRKTHTCTQTCTHTHTHTNGLGILSFVALVSRLSLLLTQTNVVVLCLMSQILHSTAFKVYSIPFPTNLYKMYINSKSKLCYNSRIQT